MTLSNSDKFYEDLRNLKGSSSMKKYELTDETKVYMGKTLHRIRALIDIPNDFVIVKTGELGGWVESENNLSHNGTCWVYDNGRAFEDAKIYQHGAVIDNGQVYDSGRVFGNGWVCDNGRVFGYGQVYGYGRVRGNGRLFGEGRVFGQGVIDGYGKLSGYGKISSGRVSNDLWEASPLYIAGSINECGMASKTEFYIGRECHTFDYWREHYQHYHAIARAHGFEDHIAEYVDYFNLAVKLYNGGEPIVLETSQESPNESLEEL